MEEISICIAFMPAIATGLANPLSRPIWIVPDLRSRGSPDAGFYLSNPLESRQSRIVLDKIARDPLGDFV
jgi:hypothetical protein